MEVENEKVISETSTESETATPEDSSDTKEGDSSTSEGATILTEEKIREIVKGMLGEFVDRFQNGTESIADEKSTENKQEKDTPINESELI